MLKAPRPSFNHAIIRYCNVYAYQYTSTTSSTSGTTPRAIPGTASEKVSPSLSYGASAANAPPLPAIVSVQPYPHANSAP